MQTHIHKPQWHSIRLRLEQLIHDPRFWAITVLVVLFGLMILTTILSDKSVGGPYPLHPLYPYMP